MVGAMKNRILFIIMTMVLFVASTTAQNYQLRVNRHGDVTYQRNTSEMTSITLNNGVATFTHNTAGATNISFSEIDSITFYYNNGGQPTSTYTVTVLSNNETMGSATGGGTFNEGATIVISATANSGYHFTQWSDGSTEATRAITVTANATYIAYFEEDVRYTITVLTNNATMGSATGGGTFEPNATTVISATANSGYHFLYWNDAVTEATRVITVTNNATYTANFAADVYYTITTQTNDESMGTTTGSGQYLSGSSATISASAYSGYHFLRWNDGNTEATRSVVVTSNTTYTAYFEENASTDQYYTLTVLSSNNTMGYATGGGQFLSGTTTTISAIPNSGYHFTQWNDGNTNATRSVTVTNNATYTAYFEEDVHYTLTVMPNDANMGSTIGSGTYDQNAQVIISATANSGYHFTQWNDGNTNAIRTITVTGNATYIAYFEEDIHYTVTVVSDNDGMGTVSGGGTFEPNATTIIAATPNIGYHFVRWNDNDTTTPRTITVTSDITYTAYFAIDNSSEPDTIHNQDTTAIDTMSGIHITWNNGAAPTIINGYASQGLSITAAGENVTVAAATGIDDLTYIIDGTSVDGNLIINTDKSLILYMDGLHLHSTTSPAIHVVDDHRVTIHLASESTNFVSDTTNITNTTHKAALQSQGKFEIQGDGTLTVKGYTKHAIQSSGKTVVMGGTINVYGQSSTGDAMNVDDFVMQDGNLTVNSLGDGIDGDQGYIAVSGGTIDITCTSAGVKGLGCDSVINIGGGNITINMSGADSKGISGNSNIYLTDGTQNITVSGNQSKGIKADTNLVISGGNLTVNANGTNVVTSGNISYCTGLKADGQIMINGGNINITCSTSNAGGKCISADGNVTITAGTTTLSALGQSGTYTATSGTGTYTTVGIKSNANVTINGGDITMTVGGKGISVDTNFYMNGGNVNITTSGAGAVTAGSGTSATDGYCSAGVSADGNVYINTGTISCVSSGTGGRGFKVDGTFNVGNVGNSDDLTHIYVKTSGSAVNVSSSGGWGGWGGTSSDYWKGLPKGIKVTGSIHINSGHVNAFCAQTSGDPTGEAIESKDSIIINGGYIEANSYDDAINATNYILINDGYIWAYARGNDAIDCNGAEENGSGVTLEINGGTVIACGTEVAVDDCGDRGGYIQATNCTLVLIGGNMGTTEATPVLTGQKALTISTSTSGGGGWGGNQSSGGLTTAQNGFTVQDNNGNEIMTFKWPSVNTGQSGFEDTTVGAKPGPGDNSSSGIYITTPDIQSGSYKYWTSPTISGGTSWHGLYNGATVTTSGNGTSVTAE